MRFSKRLDPANVTDDSTDIVRFGRINNEDILPCAVEGLPTWITDHVVTPRASQDPVAALADSFLVATRDVVEWLDLADELRY